MNDVTISQIKNEQLNDHLDALCEIIVSSVNSGASISFMHPFALDDARSFWKTKVFPAVNEGNRVLFIAAIDGQIAGTVQLDVALPPNQPHRCEVAKMAVNPIYRRRGVAKALLTALEVEARHRNKSLITLDTRTGDLAQGIYASFGFEEAGIIPQFALDPDGKNYHSTTYMYKKI